MEAWINWGSSGHGLPVVPVQQSLPAIGACRIILVRHLQHPTALYPLSARPLLGQSTPSDRTLGGASYCK